MPTAARKIEHGFALWLTGLPACGKSTITQALVTRLAQRGLKAAVLESDALRKVLTPHPRYTEEERQVFYASMLYMGRLLTEHGVPVIFDATANRRAYRDAARAQIPKFLEIYVDTALETCMARDPKGIYKKGQEGKASNVPGLQSPYEAPRLPDLVIDGEKDEAEDAAEKMVALLIEKKFLP